VLTLVYGGSGSGKSEYAEDAALRLDGKRVYLATMQPYGTEGKRRIARHRSLRQGKGFITVEKYTDIADIACTDSVILLECVTNLVANEMFCSGGVKKAQFVAKKIVEDIKRLYNVNKDMIIVSGAVGCDGEVYSKDTLDYIATVGEVNSELAKIADRVVEIACSIEIIVK
jgi:adenosylcobinamide kinase/adenosylcobinamide-phosphate guanylyltransferase